MKNRTAKITIQSEGGYIHVYGPYLEMKDIYPQLKSKKFRYDGNKKSWFIGENKMSVGDVEELIAGLQSGNTKTIEKEKQDNDSELREIADECKGTRFLQVYMQRGELVVVGLPVNYLSRDAIAEGGFRRENGKYIFTRPVKKLAKIILGYEAQLERNYRDIKKYENQTIGVFPYDARFLIEGDILTIGTGDKEMRDYIKAAFPMARWNISRWEVPISEVNDMDKSVEIIKNGCDILGAKALQKKIDDGRMTSKNGIYSARYNTAWGGLDMYDYPVGKIVKNPFESTPELLKIVSVKKMEKYEDDDYFFKVDYAPLTSEELQRVEIENKERLNRSKAQNIIDEAIKTIILANNKPNNLEPKGDMWITDSAKRLSVYGGGTWFHINGDTIYYIVNNGGDGDSWERNNVETGGAGAIGYVLKSEDIAKTLEYALPIAGFRKNTRLIK